MASLKIYLIFKSQHQNMALCSKMNLQHTMKGCRMMKDKKKNTSRNTPEGSYVGVGIAIGVALGVALKNIPIGIALGVAVGAALDGSRNRNNRKRK